MQLHTKKNPPKNLKDEIAKSRYTVDMWVAPEKWDLSIRRNVLCEICHHSISFVPSIDALCSLCNVVAHITCLNEAQRKQTFRNCWICTDCNDDLAYSKKKFITKKIDDNYKVILLFISFKLKLLFANRKFQLLLRSLFRNHGGEFTKGEDI